MTVHPVTASQLTIAAEALFAAVPEPERSARVTAFQEAQLAAEPGVVFLWAGDESGHCLGAVIAFPDGHAGANLWPAGVTDESRRSETEDALYPALIESLRVRGIRIAQLVAPQGLTLPLPGLVRNRFDHIATLVEMTGDLDRIHPPWSGISVDLVPYDPSLESRFAACLGRTFLGTLDTPELNGTRTDLETLASFRHGMTAPPSHWNLASFDGQDLGLLLLKPSGDGAQVEITYLGVVPEWRGRGVGRALLAIAVEQSRALGAAKMTLSLDVRNSPALALYRRAEFLECGSYEVFVAVIKS